MTELNGILQGVGLPAIVRFVAGLSKTGCLELGEGEWRGTITFEDGQITAAALGSHTGLSALEAMVEVLPGARFAFESRPGHVGEPALRLEPSSVLMHLDEAAAGFRRGARQLPSPEAVPSVIANTAADADEPLHLDRACLQTLLAVDGQRSVRNIVADRGSIDALWQLAKLAELGLVKLEAGEQPVGNCPHLGFEDDPSSSFGRPTRLHRCFASATPLPLSLDQQRELCLSDHFDTCPRLTPPGPANWTSQSVAAELPLRDIHARPHRVAATPTEDARIVRLRSIRNPAADAGDGSDPTPLRVSNVIGRSGPTPLRARLNRVPPVNDAITAATLPSTPSAVAPAPVRETQHELHHPDEPISAKAIEAHEAESPALLPTRPRLIAMAVGIVGLVIVAGLAYLLLPQLGAIMGSDGVDTATLPNAGRVAAGTPVTNLPSVRVTPVPVSGVQATSVPQLAPGLGTSQNAPVNTASSPSPPLFEERFTTKDANWPSDPQGVGLITNGAYRIVTRTAGQFAAIGAPIANVPADVLVNASFRKIGGPAGGGYGIIVRAQDLSTLDGTAQDGHYYVLEAGDKGEVGIWRRDGDHWVDLLPWQRSDAVKTGSASNDLSVRAVGNTLTLSVNGTQVATRTDATLTTGAAGLFVGGDGNQVTVSDFSIQSP